MLKSMTSTITRICNITHKQHVNIYLNVEWLTIRSSLNVLWEEDKLSQRAVMHPSDALFHIFKNSLPWPKHHYKISFDLWPGGKSPWCCCHFRDCPSRARRREGGTTLTSPARAWAIAFLRFSLVWPSG